MEEQLSRDPMCEEEIKKRFTALYEAFKYGAPPHAGMAPGIDRMLMLLLDEDTIRETIAFPMTASGADLMMDAGILRIEKHDDKLCFRNPGLLRLPLEQIYEGGNSKARNPRIQNMLRMVGFGENIGSGFPQIIAAWKETKWGEPELKNKIELDEVELVLPLGKVANVVKDVVKEQADILSIMVENPTVTAAELASMLGLTSRHIQRLIKDLVEKEIIRREGGRKLGKWIIL